MISDVDQRDKKYRIIYEEANLAHPESYIVAVFDITGAEPKKVFEHIQKTGDPAWMMEAARKAIIKLP